MIFATPGRACGLALFIGVEVVLFLVRDRIRAGRMRGKRGQMRRKRAIGPALFVCLIFAISVMAVACGGGGSEGLPRRELPDNATPEKIMLEGLNATDGAKTLHYKFNYSFKIPPTAEQTYTREVSFEGEGNYDASSGDAEAHMIWHSFDMEFDYKLYRGIQYYRTKEDGTWYQLPQGRNLAVPSISEITRNTAEYMDNFQKISRLDDQVINDRDCYHIAMVPNFDAIMQNQQFLDMLRGEREQLDEETLKKIEETQQRLKNASVVYEYWIDKEYLVLRRTLYNIEIMETDEKTQSSYPVKLVMEIEFPAYNVKLNISPPESSVMHESGT
jgi:hypothetical protein